MSTSFFETELTSTEQRLRQANQVLESTPLGDGGIFGRVKLARQKMEEIKAACIQKAHGTLPNPEGPTILPDYDDLRKGVRRKIVKIPITEQAQENLQAKSFDGSSKSPLGPVKPQGVGKSRFSVVKDLSGTAAMSSKKKPRHKADPTAAKPSAFGSMKKHSVYNEDAKIRNSLMIQGFERKSKLGGQGQGPSDAPRDSIDVTNHDEKNPAAIQRPSTLVEMRNSLFKFDTAIVTTDNIREPDLEIDEVLSDLSDYDLEIELVDMEDLSEDHEQEGQDNPSYLLSLQVLQTDNTFLKSTSGYGQNVAAQFDFDERDSNKFAQRIKLQDSPEALDQRPCLMALNGEILKTRPLYKSVDETEGKGICIPKQLVCSDPSGSVLTVERLVMNSLRTHDIKHLEESKQIANSSVGVLYGDGTSDHSKVSLKANQSALYAYKPNPKFVESNFQVEEVLKIESEGDSYTLQTSKVPVLLSYELSRERKPIGLSQGDEFFFNNVDGVSVEGILPAGWKDEDFENFKPTTKNWELECLNRSVNDSSLFKYFLLADLKNSTDGKEIETLDRAVRECFDSTKNLARMMKIKREYLMKIARKERPALLKLAVIRKYEELGLKKKISEILFFYAQPATGAEDASAKVTIKDKLKSQFLSKSNIMRLGKTVQTTLPKLRNEFERSNILYSIDTDFDMEIGFSTSLGKFFLQTHDNNQPQDTDYHEPEGLVELAGGNYSELLSDKFSEGYTADHPRDGLWIPLPKQSEVKVPNNALLFYCGTVARVSTQKVLLV